MNNLPIDQYVLAVLSTSGLKPWTPVQLQKVFFLLDKNLGDAIGGPKFDFAAYDYGPFDADVYRQVDALQYEGRAQITKPQVGGMRTYALTPEGQALGEAKLSSLEPR